MVSSLAIDQYLLKIQLGCDLFEPIKSKATPFHQFKVKHSDAVRVRLFFGFGWRDGYIQSVYRRSAAECHKIVCGLQFCRYEIRIQSASHFAVSAIGFDKGHGDGLFL
jgi:hypothetical protein